MRADDTFHARCDNAHRAGDRSKIRVCSQHNPAVYPADFYVNSLEELAALAVTVD